MVKGDPKQGHLAVGPSFLPTALYGPYWVVAFDANYTWAIVSGGPPSSPSKAAPGKCVNVAASALNPNGAGAAPAPQRCRVRVRGCLPAPPPPTALLPLHRTAAGNGEGLWLFTRVPVANQSTVDALKATADSLGFDTSVLLPVQQSGCWEYDTFPTGGGWSFFTW